MAEGQRSRTTSGALVWILALCVGWPATAAGAEIEEIVVTARKVDEGIHEAPITVNAFTGDQLEDAGVVQTADFVQFIPNVTLAESQTMGTSFLTVRGLSRVRNGELPVAVVVDDVLVVNARQFISQIFDVRQVEVAKGPQGALYGRNASNGAIIITTNAPSSEPEGYVKMSYGTADEVGLEGAWSGPVGETLAVRFSGRALERDGYFTNVNLDDEVDPFRDRTLRGRATWSPSDTLVLDVKAQVSKHEGKGIGFHWPGAAMFEVFGVFLGTAEELGVTVDQVVSQGGDLVDLPYVANNPDRGTRDTAGVSVKLDKVFDWGAFKSVTTYDELEASSVADRAPYLSYLDGTQNSYVDVEGWSQELRLSSATEGRLRWQAGAYYLSWERLRSTVTGVDLGLGIKRATDTPEFEDSTNPTDVAPGNFLSFLEDSHAWAVFGSVDFDLTDRFTASKYQIKHPARQADIVDKFGKSDGVVGRKFTRLNNNGIARQQGRRQFAGYQEERKIPRQNARRRAQGALKQQDILARAIALQDLTFITTRPLRHVIDIIGGKRDFNLGQLLYFPAFSHDQCADFTGALTDTRRYFAEPVRPFNGR